MGRPIDYGTDARPARGRPGRVMGVGVVVVVCGGLLMFAPLLFPSWSMNKYFVTLGFLLACVGLSCAMHGVWDWWKGR